MWHPNTRINHFHNLGGLSSGVDIRAHFNASKEHRVASSQKNGTPFLKDMHKPFSNFDVIGNKMPNKIGFTLYNLKTGVSCTGEEIELSPQP
jgi:hypothetical protein